MTDPVNRKTTKYRFDKRNEEENKWLKTIVEIEGEIQEIRNSEEEKEGNVLFVQKTQILSIIRI